MHKTKRFWAVRNELLLPLKIRDAEGGDITLIHEWVVTCHVVGPCHHGMACPQVADRGTASDKEGSCE